MSALVQLVGLKLLMTEIEQTHLLCGPVCSGKSTALSYIDENYDVSTTEIKVAARHMYHAFEIRSVSISEWWAGKHFRFR